MRLMLYVLHILKYDLNPKVDHFTTTAIERFTKLLQSEHN